MKKTRVLIVEDSKVFQQILAKILAQDKSIEVVGIADDPYIARSMITKTDPDVLTLDIELPKMDGISFLKKLMHAHPMPVLMLSAYTEQGSMKTLEALALGAVDYIKKPTIEELADFDKCAIRITRAIKNAAKAKCFNLEPLTEMPSNLNHNFPRYLEQGEEFLDKQIIVMGASTGGVETIEFILKSFSSNMPPIIIVQHIGREFTPLFVERLNKIVAASLCVATDSMQLHPGKIYLAPGARHTTVYQHKNKYYIKLINLHEKMAHTPSIDILFSSVAKIYQNRAIGVLLTGMGKDGAEGLKELHDEGAYTIVQDEETSVVWGMPSAAVKLNAASKVVPLPQIPYEIVAELNLRAKSWKR